MVLSTHLDRRAPADDQCSVVFPAKTTGVHIRPQTGVVPQHVGDALFGADVIDFHTLCQKKKNPFEQFVFAIV